MHNRLKWYGLTGALALFAVLFVVGCQGPVGPEVNTGTVIGTVTNALTGKPEAGVKVILDPAVKDANIVTDDKGIFTAQLPIGAYSATLQKPNFADATLSLSVASGQTATKNATLKTTAPAPVVVSAGAAQTATPGTTVTFKAAVTATDGSTATAYKWTQTAGPAGSIDNPAAETVKVTLPDAATFKAAIIKGMALLDRAQVQAVSPLALAAQVTTFKVTVTTATGSYSGTVNVTADVPYAVSTGLADVPVGVPVLLNGKASGPYSWTLAGPSGSKAALSDVTSRNPSFTPDVVGKYTLTEATSKATVLVYAGTWAGAVSGKDDKGAPLSAACTSCHNGRTAPDNFTAWSQSGHAYIVSDNLTTSTHYSESCFACHTVGFNKTAAAVNNGVDDQTDYASFLASGLLSKAIPTSWTTTLSKFPKTASLMNIQCENCHGPNTGTGLHADGALNAARVDIASDVCAACHGKPPSHGKFQQWQNSNHGNFELAIDESGSASCARCHTGQGFMAWLKQGDLTKQIQGKGGNATAAEMTAIVSKDNAQPVTCVVCHDPHDVGTSNHVDASIASTNVRIEGNTALLPSGYQAREVGLGAICITCHNTRNGTHNDSTPSASASPDQAPHAAAQGDVLMGENAFFVNLPQRSPHAALEDTCVTCHMQSSPAPLAYSKDGAGANHGFTADIKMCAECHSETLNGEAFQAGYEARIEALGNQMGAYLLKKMGAQFTIQDYTPHTYNNKPYDVKSDPLVLSKDNIASAVPTEPHGRQGFIFTLKNPVTVAYTVAGEGPHTMSVKEVQAQVGSISADGKTPAFTQNDVLVKAGWNYFLVHGDASLGVHNPAFVSAVLDASINALK